MLSARTWNDAANLLGVDFNPAAASARAAIAEAGFTTRDLVAEAEADQRRTLGRAADIPQPYPEIAVRASKARSLRDAVDDPWRPLWELDSPAERLTRLAVRQRDRRLSESKTWAVSAGWVSMANGIKRFTGTCRECGHEFTVTRPVVSSRRWPSVCDGCKLERERSRKRNWARRKRASAA
ncbi:hypothetical protein [Streptomyces sp. CNZ748]|uniref:hypothetical protein n=1 Tax=Streptomyces sp. CNZ748 TaxID=2885160 RepID=UPI001E3BE174|nr:hypothetical protein [Streptomyces sp. CNZ748]